MARDVLLDRRSRERGIIEPKAVEALLRRHASVSADSGDQIWSLLNLEIWHRTCIDREGIQTLPDISVARDVRAPDGDADIVGPSLDSATHAHTVAQVGPAAAAR